MPKAILGFMSLVILFTGFLVDAELDEPVIWDVTQVNSSTFIAVVAPGLGYDQANDYCNLTFGGHLAVLPSNDAIDAINALQIDHHFFIPWIGLRRSSENSSVFEWANGEPFINNGLLDVDSKANETKDCVILSFEGRSCRTSKRSFICEIEDLNMTSSVEVRNILQTSLNESQRNELVQHVTMMTSYYGEYGYTMVADSRHDFISAESRCCALNGSLTSVLSVAEQEHIMNMTGSFAYGYRSVWTGYYRKGTEFAWTDGSTGSPATDISQLVNDADSQCFAMTVRTGVWHTEDCSKRKYFVCKFPERKTSMNCDVLLDLSLHTTVVMTTTGSTVSMTTMGPTAGVTSVDHIVSLTTRGVEDDPNIALEHLLAETPPSNPDVTAVQGTLSTSYQDPSAIDETGLRATASLIELLVVASQSTAPRNDSIEGKTEFVVDIASRVLLVNESVLNDPSNSESLNSIRQSLESQLALFQNKSKDNLMHHSARMSVNAQKIPKTASDEEAGLLLKAALVPANSSPTGSQLTADVTKAPGGRSEQTTGVSVFLPSSVWNVASVSARTVPVTFIAYASDVFFPTPSSEQRPSGFVVSAVVEGATENMDGVLNDPVAFSLGDDTGSSPWSRSCVYWEEDSAEWSSRGLALAVSVSQSIVCQSSHLTSFTVILDTGIEKSSRVLDVITTIGCVVSIVLLVITIASFLLARNLKLRTTHKILLNLCGALIGLYACLFGVESVQQVAGCVAVGALNHYFLLSAHAWMTVEAVNMYLMFVKVFDAKSRHMVFKGCLFAWGAPCLIVIIVLAVDYRLYRGPYSCYLCPGIAKYITIHAVVGSLLLTNSVLFVIILYKLKRNRSNMSAARGESDAAETLRRLQTAFAISCLLGISWVFGFFMHGGAWFVFALFFCLNAYQGVFIFLLFCARQPEIRAFWRGLAHCVWVPPVKPKGYSSGSGQTKINTTNVEMVS